MKKFFTLIALALCAQASMAQDVIASFTFPNEIMATQTEQEKADAIAKTASAEGVAGTGCTVDYAKIGGYTSSGGENWKVLNGVYFQKLTHATQAFITLHLNSGKFQAGDVLKATLYNGSTTADGLKVKEATATAHNVDHTKEAASTLVYTLTANDLNEDGSLTPRSEKIIGHTPMGRFGNSETELSGAVLFLLNNEAASFITGVTIPIDGGFSAYSGV